MHVFRCMYTHMQVKGRPEITVLCLPQLPSDSFAEAGYLVEPRTHSLFNLFSQLAPASFPRSWVLGKAGHHIHASQHLCGITNSLGSPRTSFLCQYLLESVFDLALCRCALYANTTSAFSLMPNVADAHTHSIFPLSGVLQLFHPNVWLASPLFLKKKLCVCSSVQTSTWRSEADFRSLPLLSYFLRQSVIEPGAHDLG